MEYLLGLLNTKVIGSIIAFLNPTVSFQAADIDRIPVVYSPTSNELVQKNVQENIKQSKNDWDSYETSWDFKRNPLI